MKRLFLIRHAKSSWADITLDDFDRPLNKRGKRDAPEMAGRLASLAVKADLIIASPAKRAKQTAVRIAKGIGYDKSAIRYYQDLYLGSLESYLKIITIQLRKFDTLVVVGHNNTITVLGEHLSGKSLVNVPTCGIVALEYSAKGGFTDQPAKGQLLFFDFPKNRG